MLRLVLVLVAFVVATPGFASGATTGAVAPQHPVLIVDRRPQSVSLYFSLPASDLTMLFGTGAEDLLGQDYTIDIEGLYEGTFELADRIFASVQTAMDGWPVLFEGISMMVHDPEALPEFKTPWDGETSIAVCTSPETVDKMGLDALQAYLGYFAWKVNGMAPITLAFQGADSSDLKIEIREFWNMQHTGSRIETLSGGGTLLLQAGQGSRLGSATLWLLAVACLGVAAVFFVLHAREGRTGQKTLDRV
jgi:hypothetical protein